MEILEIAEILKGEPLKPTDGIDMQKIREIEEKISIVIPEKLTEFYLHLGNLTFISQSFERFLPLDEFELKDNKLYFAEENQCVCSWAVDLRTLQVYQDNYDEIYDEEIQLEDFIKILMYYNCAQGGLPFAGQGKANKINDVFTVVSDEWEMVVNHNGLIIYSNENNLIWGFVDEDMLADNSFFLSFGNELLFKDYCERLNAVEL